MPHGIKARIRNITTTPHKADRIHTVCMLCIIQYLLIFGADTLVMSAAITTLIFVRDAGMALITEELAGLS